MSGRGHSLVSGHIREAVLYTAMQFAYRTCVSILDLLGLDHAGIQAAQADRGKNERRCIFTGGSQRSAVGDP